MTKHGKAIAGYLALTLAILLLAWAGVARSQNTASMPLYQVHGSGTSNPAPIIWRVMDVMMARTKPKIAMSYRSIGSGAGGDEFTNSTSAFGCGDVPLSKTNFASIQAPKQMMHVPFLVGSVSIFHNIPGIGEDLFLPPCTLARIFRGAIDRWNHSEIVGNNSHLPDLARIGNEINIVHRNPGSSSTYALTHYLSRACSSEWNNLTNVASTDIGSSPGQNRRVGVTTDWHDDAPGRWTTGTNSQTMVEKMASNLYSLGYVESGQGLAAGLNEVQILNARNTRLTSTTSDIASEPFIQSQFVLSNLTSANWTDVNPVYSNASEKQWPMVLGTYFYVMANVTNLNETGGLLKMFLTYMLSDDVANLMPEYNFIALPDNIRKNLTALLGSTMTVAATPNWQIESVSTQTYAGQQDFVFSAKRDSYLMSTVSSLALDNKEAKSTLKLGDAYQVHGSGSFVSALMIRHGMQILQSRARVPITMTYRTVGSVEAQAEFADYVNMYQSYNHFKVGDMPLDSFVWSNLTGTPGSPIGAVLQLPFAISALGLFHTKSFGRPSLALNCNLLARLYSGTLKYWNDTDLVNLNQATSSIADQKASADIAVFAMAAPSGATYALTGYLAKSCSDTWKLTSEPSVTVAWPPTIRTSFQGVNITTPELMQAALSGTPNSVGYLPAALGYNAGLKEVQLDVPEAAEASSQPQQQQKTRRLTSQDANLTLVVAQSNEAVFNDVSANLEAVVKSALYGIPGTWPMPMVQYIYMFRNLSGYGYSGPLLRAFVEFLVPGSITGEGSNLAIQSGLTPMPEAVQKIVRDAVADVSLKTLTVNWHTEGEGLADGDAGAALYTFSANRQSYDAYELDQLRSALSQVQLQLSYGLLTVVRVACTPDTFGYIRLLRGDVQDMANSPIRILDEMGSASAIVDVLSRTLGGAKGDSSQQQMVATSTPLVVHPGPLPEAVWTKVSLLAPVLQIPVSIRPVAVIYKGQPGLKLGLCTLAGILSGSITSWNDRQIQDANVALRLPSSNKPIQLLVTDKEGGDVDAVLRYIQKGSEAAGCGQYNKTISLAPSVIVATDIVTRLVKGGNYSGLALVAASYLVLDGTTGAGLQAAALPSSRTGTFVTPLQAPSTLSDSSCSSSGCPDLVTSAYTNAVDAAAGSLTSVPYDASGSWSSVSLIPMSQADIYPLVRFDYLIVPADVSNFGNAGAAIRGIIRYAIHSAMASRIQEALAPYFSPLGPSARRSLSEAAATQLTVARGAGSWEIVSSSTDIVSDPSSTLVLSRAPSVADVALTSSVVTTSSVAEESSALSLEVVQEEAVKAAKQAAAENQVNVDKLNRTYGIAVAALVLGLILSVLSLLLALYAVALVRGSGSSSQYKYDKQMFHVPISGGGGRGDQIELPVQVPYAGTSNEDRVLMEP
ncbi:hypothetical protein Vretimale_7646 [Volvox reticuliferus]|uniref:PBP domain-containing protein n=1 Tax=Volvox reticuliferus TaxID=1737510 RepID=A0A8J4C9J1_9CHLO|nr:hypothetical protein Vretifemale_7737 [Volvox reticuliferus]GIM02806.1 hypothetical protein Vretimale_7646 [Volvox reticuliferus]